MNVKGVGHKIKPPQGGNSIHFLIYNFKIY